MKKTSAGKWINGVKVFWSPGRRMWVGYDPGMNHVVVAAETAEAAILLAQEWREVKAAAKRKNPKLYTIAYMKRGIVPSVYTMVLADSAAEAVAMVLKKMKDVVQIVDIHRQDGRNL